jgi:hypothetical protein
VAVPVSIDITQICRRASNPDVETRAKINWLPSGENREVFDVLLAGQILGGVFRQSNSIRWLGDPANRPAIGKHSYSGR